MSAVRKSRAASAESSKTKGGTKDRPLRARKSIRRKSIRNKRLVCDLMEFVRSYVVMTEPQLMTVALWIVHTHCVQAAEQTPYLAVTSPEKQCGKSRLLETLDLLCARAWTAILPSEAVIYRHVHNTTPTLLLDEIDTIFNPRSADRYEGLRALLNAGHRRGSTVPRCVGSSNKIVEFNTFCPKVLAGIGTLPDTVADRSLPIRLERRKPDEEVKRFIHREAEPIATALRERIEQWATDDRLETLRELRPTMPEQLSDRMQEGCESLVSIADELGCGDEARDALVALLTGERLDDQESMRLRLLRDVKAVFEARDAKLGKRTRTISTQVLLEGLYAIEEAGWSSYYGRALDARDLANLLKHYGARPVSIRFSETKGRRPKVAKVAKGYKRDPLHEVWERYLRSPDVTEVTPPRKAR